MPKTITQLPSGTANSSAVVAADNAAGTLTEKVTLGAVAALASSNGAAALPSTGLSITLGGGWWVGSPKPFFNLVPAQATQFGSAYNRYTGKWVTGFIYNEASYTTGTRLTAITFSDLEGVTGNFSPATCAGLTSLTADSLAYVGGNFTPATMASLTSLSFPNLTNVFGNFNPSSMTNVASLSLANLVYVGGSFTPAVGYDGTSAFQSSGTLSVPNLAYIGGSLSGSSSGLGSAWSFPSLTYIGSTLTVSFGYMSSLSFPSLSYLGTGGISMTSAPRLGTISLPALTYCLGGMSFIGTPNLTSVTLPVDGTLKLFSGSFSMSSTGSLSQSSVDNVLQALASLDGTNGTTSYTQAVTMTASCSAPSNSGSTTTTGSSFVCSGTTCTVSWTAHGYATGDVLRISGITTATNANRYAVITVVNANQFTYTITSQTATGAGTATVVKAAASAKTLVTRGVTLTTN
jgi:hypothetical protein